MEIAIFAVCGTLSTELTRGPPRVSSALSLRECPKFDMVWLNCSPIPVGEEGGNFLVKMIPSRRGRRGGGRHPVVWKEGGGLGVNF
jgi:hypothetical protein